MEITDLPGTYSLSFYSPEEQIARDFLVKQKPDLVVDVVDASNLERNLYLTLQLIETGLPVMVLLNMADVAERHGVEIDAQLLTERLQVEAVVTAVASKQIGLEKLKDAMIRQTNGKIEKPLLNYDETIEKEIDKLSMEVKKDQQLSRNLTPAGCRSSFWKGMCLCWVRSWRRPDWARYCLTA